MSICTRATFSALLTFVLAQLTLGEDRPRPLDRLANHVTESVHYHGEPHAATYEARTFLFDRSADRFSATPFAPSYPTNPKILCVNVQASEAGCIDAGMDVVLLLPPSRAPPVIS
jgi:hypothetical protein